METIRLPSVMDETSKVYCLKEKSIGFVPTMGALHQGHLKLVKRAAYENDITVVSIFVNPLQFSQGEDFDQYPRDIQGDINKLGDLGAHIIFMPEVTSLYADNFNTYIEVKGLSDKLCGRYRPGHFKGVTTVVNKLFNLVRPKRAYFGQKDYQQVLIIRKMIHDLNMTGEVIMCPTVREADGLAMSSRNLYLSPEGRRDALLIHKALKMVEEGLINREMGLSDVPERLSSILKTGKTISEIQYASVYDPRSLEEITDQSMEIYKNQSVLLAVALKIGSTRLIDNALVSI